VIQTLMAEAFLSMKKKEKNDHPRAYRDAKDFESPALPPDVGTVDLHRDFK